MHVRTATYRYLRLAVSVALGAILAVTWIGSGQQIEAVSPTVVDRNLAVRTVVSGLDVPTTMAFLGSSDILFSKRIWEECREWSTGPFKAPCWILP
jgi:hypothetical protein